MKVNLTARLPLWEADTTQNCFIDWVKAEINLYDTTPPFSWTLFGERVVWVGEFNHSRTSVKVTVAFQFSAI